MAMEPIELFVQRLNRVRWREKSITAEAEALIQEFLHGLRPAIQHMCLARGVSPAHAYGLTQTAGADSPEYKHAVRVLFEQGRFFGAGVRESLIVIVSSAYGWDHDPELSAFPSPWRPLLDLIQMGYTPSGDEDPDGQWVQLWIGHRGGIARYQIV
jgi:hypothetical protein